MKSNQKFYQLTRLAIERLIASENSVVDLKYKFRFLQKNNVIETVILYLRIWTYDTKFIFSKMQSTLTTNMKFW